ncbi:hypothetical protein BLL52_1446, partial [Rhodoferax antarcticus ANT.BR]
NPRPPLLAGELPLLMDTEYSGDVSIRARHCWRANSLSYRTCQTYAVFQSAPAIAGGRTGYEGVYAVTEQGFNPRPPLLAGELHPMGRSTLR